MFSGNSSTSFKATQSKNKVLGIIQENLESNLGAVEITEKGQVIVNARKFDGFSHEVIMTGFVREKEGRYTIELNYETKLTWVFWVVLLVGLFFFFIGVFIFLLPLMSKNEVKNKADKALESLRYEFN
jgi:hypothetical protein